MLLIGFVLLPISFCENTRNTRVYRCVIESCSGWLLNKLPEVKSFILDDFERKYERTTFKRMPGRRPEAFFFSESGRILERIGIEDYTREELNKMMIEKGIPKNREFITRDEV